MNKNALYLAGLLNEDEFNQTDSSYAYRLGVLQGATKVVKNILEPALRQLENPEWNREEDGPLMLEHLEKAVREALEKIKSIQEYLH